MSATLNYGALVRSVLTLDALDQSDGLDELCAGVPDYDKGRVAHAVKQTRDELERLLIALNVWGEDSRAQVARELLTELRREAGGSEVDPAAERAAALEDPRR